MRKSTQKIVSARTLAAYRAHRTMVAQQLRGDATRAVRIELANKLAAYDRLLSTLKIAA